MSPNQQLKKIQNKVWPMLQVLSIGMYKRWNPNMQSLPISQVKHSLCLIYYWIFDWIMSNNSIETSKAWCHYVFRGITNNTFYRPAKIILCIWRVGNRFLRLTQSATLSLHFIRIWFLKVGISDNEAGYPV